MSINDYKPRVIDQLLSRKLRGKGAVLLKVQNGVENIHR